MKLKYIVMFGVIGAIALFAVWRTATLENRIKALEQK